MQSILHRNLVPRPRVADLFGIKGRCWLRKQPLPPDEELAVEAMLRQLDFHARELRIIDASLGQAALHSPEIKRLMTLAGVGATVAISIVAAVGDFHRFSHPERLVSYLGLNPRVKQSGGQPASHGRITKQVVRTRAGCSSRPPGRRSRNLQRGWTLKGDCVAIEFSNHAVERFARRSGREMTPENAYHQLCHMLSASGVAKEAPTSWRRMIGSTLVICAKATLFTRWC